MDREQVTATIAKFRKRADKKAKGNGDADIDAEIRRLGDGFAPVLGSNDPPECWGLG
jgi:hypothetical protein